MPVESCRSCTLLPSWSATLTAYAIQSAESSNENSVTFAIGTAGSEVPRFTSSSIVPVCAAVLAPAPAPDAELRRLRAFGRSATARRAASTAGSRGARVYKEGNPLVVAGNTQRGCSAALRAAATTTAATTRRALRRGLVPDGKAPFLRTRLCSADRDFGVTLVGSDDVREPAAVVGDAGSANLLPRQQVVQGELAAMRRIRCPSRDGFRLPRAI